ncbi:hypothetical protein [Hyphococcus sp. DH-69]|uniref:hypothetical protein n=1 Tax=Hyphococcus formosus TaxID=3143534 RepID=UPI00398A94C1
MKKYLTVFAILVGSVLSSVNAQLPEIEPERKIPPGGIQPIKPKPSYESATEMSASIETPADITASRAFGQRFWTHPFYHGGQSINGINAKCLSVVRLNLDNVSRETPVTARVMCHDMSASHPITGKQARLRSRNDTTLDETLDIPVRSVVSWQFSSFEPNETTQCSIVTSKPVMAFLETTRLLAGPDLDKAGDRCAGTQQITPLYPMDK